MIPLTYRALPGLSEKVSQDKMIAAAEAELAGANMIKDRLNREVTLLTNDGEYLGMFARDRVDRGYMKPGETIFRLTPRKQ
ncbi:MAG: septum formation initiator family protein [Chthoniobacteraceae bacterium]